MKKIKFDPNAIIKDDLNRYWYDSSEQDLDYIDIYRKVSDAHTIKKVIDTKYYFNTIKARDIDNTYEYKEPDKDQCPVKICKNTTLTSNFVGGVCESCYDSAIILQPVLQHLDTGLGKNLNQLTNFIIKKANETDEKIKLT